MANNENDEQEAIEGLELEGVYENEQVEENQAEDESSEQVEENQAEDESSEQVEENTQVENSNNDSQEDDYEKAPAIQQRFPKFKKPIIITAGITLLVLLSVLGMYLFGFFDDEPVKPTTEKAVAVDNKPVIPPKKKYLFKVKDIDKKRLNRKLMLLTKDELIEEEIIPSKEDTPNEPMLIPDKKSMTTDVIEDKVTLESEEVVQIPSEVIVDKNISESKNSNDLQEEIVVENVAISSSTIIEETIPEVTHKDDSTLVKIKGDTTIDTNQTTDELEVVKKDDTIVMEIIDDEIKDDITQQSEEIIASIDDTPISDTLEHEDTIILTKTKEEEPEITSEEEPEITSEEDTTSAEQDTMDAGQSFLRFAQVATIKTKLYLSFLQKINKIDKRISVCRNDVNHIEIFVGPFSSENERNGILSELNTSLVKDAFAIDFTQKEFDKRCKL